MKSVRKLWLLLACLCLCLACVLTVHAEAEVVYTNTADTITITVYSDGLARYEGSGILSNRMFPEEPVITRVEIGEGITEIANNVFSGCRDIQVITFPDSLKTVGDFVLYDCQGITVLDLNQVEYFGEGNIYCLGPDGQGPKEIIFSSKMESVPEAFCRGAVNLEKVTLPEGLKTIGSWAFSGCPNLKMITLHEGLEEIGYEAFRDSGLQSLTFPDSLKTVGDFAIYGCAELNFLDMNQVEYFGEGNIYCLGPNGEGPKEIIFSSKMESVPFRFFGGAKNLEKVTLPEGVKVIEEEAFGGCSNLKSIDLPDGLEEIRAQAFNNCGLQSIVFPDSLKTVGDMVFEGCQNLTYLDMNQVETFGEGNTWNLKELIFSSKLDTVPFRFAEIAENLEKVTLPEGVKTIGEDAFRGCINLKSINFPSTLVTIAPYAFYDCTKLTSVDLPEGLVNIGSGAFFNSGLTSITIPDSVISLAYDRCIDGSYANSGLGAFGCPNLAEVKIGKGITVIPWGCFSGVMESFEIPDNITHINGYAFRDCKNLTSVTIPAKIKYIGVYAFVNSLNLTNAVFLGDAPKMDNPFYCASFNGVAFYPKGNKTWKNVDDILNQSGGLLEAIPYTVDSQGNIIPEAPSAKKVSSAISSFKSDVYPAGSNYPANYSYIINGNMLKAYGEEAFAFELSDACFGYLPISEKRVVSYDDLIVGDILYDNTDVWVIMKKTDSGVKLAGVQSGKVAYDVNMTKAQVQEASAYRTRVGVSPYPGELDPARNIEKISGPGRLLTEAEAYETMIALQAQFPEGMPYSEKDHYHSNVITWIDKEAGTCFSQDGHGCSAFSGYLSDTAFGDLPTRWIEHVDFETIMVGDRLLAPACHEVVVLEVYSDRVVVAEGNYNERIHWGRTISKKEIEKEYQLVTRYPEGTEVPVRTQFACSHKYMDAGKPNKSGKWIYTCNSCGYTTSKAPQDADQPEVPTEPGESAEPLAAPVVTTAADPVTGGALLTWEAIEGADSYEVYRATSSKGKYTLVDTVTEAEAVVSVAVGKTHYFKVKAICAEDAELNSDYSKGVKATGKCAQPEITTEVKASTGKPVIKWSKVTSAKKYTVYRATTEDGKYTALKTVTTTSYADTSAKPGTTYFYKVKALGSKSTYNSADSAIKTGAAVCAQPALTVKIDAATGKAALSWKKITGAVSYDIYRATAADGEFEKIANQTEVSYKDLDAAANTDYWYKVQAIAEDEALNSADSAVKKAHTTLAKPVVTFAIDDATGKPMLTWEAVEGAVEYQVYRSTKSTSSYKKVNTTTDLTYTDTSVAVAKGYYYKVIAVGENVKSAYSAYKKLTAKCAQPVVTLDVNDNGQPVLKWEKVAGASKYTVYRTDTLGEEVSIGTTTKTSYTDKTVSEDALCSYRVVANGSKSAYNSAYSFVIVFGAYGME